MAERKGREEIATLDLVLVAFGEDESMTEGFT